MNLPAAQCCLLLKIFCPELPDCIVIVLKSQSLMPISSITLPQFLLLLRQPNEAPHPSAEEMQHIINRFGAWIAGLNAQGVVISTNGLEDSGTVLRGRRGSSGTDGPYAEAKEIIGGYVLIAADSFEAAVDIARDCPGLDYRMTVEVRPVREMREG